MHSFNPTPLLLLDANARDVRVDGASLVARTGNIWKANCTAYGVVFLTMQEIHDYCALESGFDPRAYLQQKRSNHERGVTVIIENVLPFL
jgi:hypothetical protein